MFFFYKKRLIIFNYVSVYRYEHIPTEARVLRSPEAGVTGEDKPPKMGAGN